MHVAHLWRYPVKSMRGEERTTAVVTENGIGGFDVLPLLVATDGAIQGFRRDYRRLRPNIVIGGVEGLAEGEWEGKFLAIGDCIIAVDSLRMRCVMTTYDPDTAEQDISVLRDIVRRYEGEIALNCDVVRGGTINLGDEVALRDSAG